MYRFSYSLNYAVRLMWNSENSAGVSAQSSTQASTPRSSDNDMGINKEILRGRAPRVPPAQSDHPAKGNTSS
jgi:hypothetical protein